MAKLGSLQYNCASLHTIDTIQAHPSLNWVLATPPASLLSFYYALLNRCTFPPTLNPLFCYSALPDLSHNTYVPFSQFLNRCFGSRFRHLSRTHV